MASAAPSFPSTKETTHYARLCRLLVDGGSQVLRETFDRVHPPGNLHSDLLDPVVHGILQSLRKKRILNPSQWGKLYPARASPSSKDFDITLLMVLLRNICGLAPPATGWDNLPPVADVTPEADIARVKHYRNQVYGHASQASVDDATFSAYWKDIRDTLVRLGGAKYAAAIDDLKNACMDPDIEEHYRELLKQWRKDDDNIMDKLGEIVEKLEELKPSVVYPGRKASRKEPLDVNECQSQLRMHYNTTISQVRITPWDQDNTVDIDEVYTSLSWLRDVRTPSGTTKKELDDYTEIFKGHGRVTNPKRMLVYGRPGIGKSTFSQKLAVDWANEKKEILKKFDVLLLIKLRDLCGIKTVPDLLQASELFPVDGMINTDSLYDYVLENQDKVLIVFDGFDEYSGEKTSPIHEIRKGNQLRDCHVIMTTRAMEGEELIKFSHVQCEIRGFLSKEQVNMFASRYITDPKEIEEFDSYLNKEKLWDIAEIPLLLLMLCLIWQNRHSKELPTSKLALHERFVETLLFHMSIKESGDKPVHSVEATSVLHDHRNELNTVGRLALDGLLQNTFNIDLKHVNLQPGSVTDRMIRSGLFQFSRLSSADPNKSMFFLHKSIQEFLAAWYIMNEAGLEKGKTACFASIDTLSKVVKLRQILKFMCEWSAEGARSVFSLLRFIGEKEDLTECLSTKMTSLFDLSFDKRLFREVSLECLINCSASSKRDLYPLFLSCVGGVVLVGDLNRRKVAEEHIFRSLDSPSCLFFSGFNLPHSIVADLNACIVISSGQRLDASRFIQKYLASQLEPEDFFLKREGDRMYLHFSRIHRKQSEKYLEMLREIAPPLPESSWRTMRRVGDLSSDHERSMCVIEDRGEPSDYSRNCLSMVSSVFVYIQTNSELSVFSNLLSAIPHPQEVTIIQNEFTRSLLEAYVVENMISHIKITASLRRLQLIKLNVTAQGVGIIADSLHLAPNLKELDLSQNPLCDGVRYLAVYLPRVPQLSVLTLARAGIGCDDCLFLADSLKHLHMLSRLDLRGNPLGRGVSSLVLSVQDLGDRSRLEELNLEDVLMTEIDIDIVSAAQSRIFRTSYHFFDGRPKPEDKWPGILTPQ